MPKVDQSSISNAQRQHLYHQAIEKAEATKDGEELANLVGVAQDTGNELLAQAVGYVAFETQYFDVARAALATSPFRGKRFDEFMDLKTALENPSYQLMMDEGSIFAI